MKIKTCDLISGAVCFFVRNEAVVPTDWGREAFRTKITLKSSIRTGFSSALKKPSLKKSL
jgi:hypothetical protein